MSMEMRIILIMCGLAMVAISAWLSAHDDRYVGGKPIWIACLIMGAIEASIGVLFK